MVNHKLPSQALSFTFCPWTVLPFSANTIMVPYLYKFSAVVIKKIDAWTAPCNVAIRANLESNISTKAYKKYHIFWYKKGADFIHILVGDEEKKKSTIALRGDKDDTLWSTHPKYLNWRKISSLFTYKHTHTH